MVGCVIAKNCNIQCPAGLTTNPEVFEGDPRAMAQYLLNVAHEVRGDPPHSVCRTCAPPRGRADLLSVTTIRHSSGRCAARHQLASSTTAHRRPGTSNATTPSTTGCWSRCAIPARRWGIGGDDPAGTWATATRASAQLAIDIERILNYEIDDRTPHRCARCTPTTAAAAISTPTPSRCPAPIRRAVVRGVLHRRDADGPQAPATTVSASRCRRHRGDRRLPGGGSPGSAATSWSATSRCSAPPAAGCSSRVRRVTGSRSG